MIRALASWFALAGACIVACIVLVVCWTLEQLRLMVADPQDATDSFYGDDK